MTTTNNNGGPGGSGIPGAPGGVAKRNPSLSAALQAADQEHTQEQGLVEAVTEGVKATAKAAPFNSHSQALAARLSGDARTINEQMGNVRKKMAELQEEIDDLERAHSAVLAATLSLQQQGSGSDA